MGDSTFLLDGPAVELRKLLRARVPASGGIEEGMKTSYEGLVAAVMRNALGGSDEGVIDRPRQGEPR